MKRLKSIKFFTLALSVSLVFFSCSDDDNATPIVVPSGEEPSNSELYTSNNSDGNIMIYNVTDLDNVSSKSLLTTSLAADGIYYDSSTDMAVQASRSNLGLEGFLDISLNDSGISIDIDVSGSADMESPREVAVNGNFYVVADNADADGNPLTADGRLYIYEKSGTSFTLRNTITTDIKLWGITFKGNDLYAVVDTTGDLAVYTNFLTNDADVSLSASKRITIEGIVRTHGITYDASSDTMILTDIGDAGNTDDDGGFQVITAFTSKFNATSNGGTLSASEQVRVSGSSTMLGNPVDVAYQASTGTVFIAEAGNGGGRILAYNNIGTGGNITPTLNNQLAAASSVYLYTE